MHCTEHDQDIFLLQHGELSPWRAFWVERHLQSCPHCQEKQAEFSRVSRLVAGAIRQDAGMSPFLFRGESPVAPTLAPITPVHFTPTYRRPYRPAFVAAVSLLAAMIAAGAYAYKAMALTPIADADNLPLNTFQASNGFSLKASQKAKDAQGNPTIFPYSTPNMNDHCEK
ncbi:MAG: zf-HC2 domain-containing protein [Fibrella sp.]|nr:zf-HC2 domain-containing protein [Armatimonadota bacterium]